jgi:enoyl-CoA hydratase/carnithine racemase
MMHYEKIDGSIIIIDLQRSVVDQARVDEMSDDLVDLCSEIAWDNEARVVVFRYTGKMFESADEQRIIWDEINPASFVDPIARLRKPVIAAIEGDAMGIGLELALACDIRIGTAGARFGLPQVCDGTIPCAGGTQRLPRLMGRSKAVEMILTGASVDAAEARRIGLFHRVVPAEELMDTAKTLATEMATRSPLAMSYVKEALHSGFDLTIDQGMRMELGLYLLLFSTQDRVEGITAFREKRKPEFEGK